MSLATNIIILIILLVVLVILLLKIKKKNDKIITLLGFLSALFLLFLSNILNFNKSGLPSIEAEVLVGDLKYDSLFVKFLIRNIGNADAYDIWYIAKLDDNFTYSASEKIQELRPTGEKVMLHSPIVTKYSYNQRIISLKLWIGYNIKVGKKRKFFYNEFEFLLTNIMTASETYSPTNNYAPKEIADLDSLIKKILPISESFSWDTGTFYQVLHIDSLNSLSIIVRDKDNKKIIWYNNFDTTLNFTWLVNKEELHNLKDKIDVNNKFQNYILVVSWSNKFHSLQIDNHEIMTIPEIHYLDVGMQYSLKKGDIVLPITKVYQNR